MLPLAWPIKPVFPLANFFVQSNLLLNSHQLANFFEVKKSRIQSYFFIAFERKKSLWTKKFASGKLSLRSSMSTKILQILSKYPPHPSCNFEAMKWRWTNFQMQVALSLLHNFTQQSLNSASAQVQILFMACRRFAMVRISDNGPSWK